LLGWCALQALNLMLSGQPIPADDAQVIGLVDQLVPPQDLQAAAARLAADMAAGRSPRRRTLQLTSHMQVCGARWLACSLLKSRSCWCNLAILPAERASGRQVTCVVSQLCFSLQTSGEGFAAAVGAFQVAQADVAKRMPGQLHYRLLLEAVAAGLASGPAAGLQQARAWCSCRPVPVCPPHIARVFW
jgi:hypothetical protein